MTYCDVCPNHNRCDVSNDCMGLDPGDMKKAGVIRPYTNDPLSACCGDPGDCSQAHLYCFNRTPKEANVDAMRTFEATQKQDKIETPEQRKVFDAVFDAERAAAQAAINGATHGSLPEQMVAVDEQIERLQAEVEQETAMERPSHYAMFPIEPMTFVMINDMPAWTMSPIKYICRAPYKHEDETIDLRKAIRCIEMRIEQLKREKEGTIGNVVGRPL